VKLAIEVGSGKGAIAQVFKQYRGITPLCIDLSYGSLRHVRDQPLSADGLLDSNLSLPIANAVADLVISYGVIHHTQLYEQLFELYASSFAGVAIGQDHIQQMTHDSLNEARSKEQLILFERISGVSLAGKSLLEVGSGIGLTVTMARLEFGAEAFGIEPSGDEYAGSLEIARTLVKGYGLSPDILLPGVGEQIPFPDDHFDVVFSSNVLEHVQNPEAVINESIRVLKPGGIMQFVVPNYGSWWEGHYGILWLPNLPRALAKVYVRACGRQPKYIDTLQLINYSDLQRILAKQSPRIEVLNWGQEVWEQRVRSLNFAEFAALSKLKMMLDWIHKFGLVAGVIWLGKKLRWETPFILTLRKCIF
jgi:SAM-dependent methyltransferase